MKDFPLFIDNDTETTLQEFLAAHREPGVTPLEPAVIARLEGLQPGELADIDMGAGGRSAFVRVDRPFSLETDPKVLGDHLRWMNGQEYVVIIGCYWVTCDAEGALRLHGDFKSASSCGAVAATRVVATSWPEQWDRLASQIQQKLARDRDGYLTVTFKNG
jgi:hypothetical protein